MNPLTRLFPPGVVMTDGAWGTELQQRGLPVGRPSDGWNLERPDLVAEVANSYVDAGSLVLLTNTFCSHPSTLRAIGLEADADSLIREGVRLARAAAADRARVFGSIGPAAGADEDSYRIPCQSMAEAGVDAIVFETFGDPSDASKALRAGRRTGLPLVMSFCFRRDSGEWKTIAGAPLALAAQTARDEGADALGANCGSGPDGFDELSERLATSSGLPVWLKPSAGLPTLVDGRPTYPVSPAAFANAMSRAAVAAFLGGCCGVGPEHIRALREKLERPDH